MNNLYLNRSLVYARQDELRQEVHANSFAKRQRADLQPGSHVPRAGLRLLGLKRLILG